MEHKDLLRLENIVEYCEAISYAIEELSIDFDSFNKSNTQRAALAFFVEQIGEEANKLSKKFIDTHPEINWRAAINFRHHIVHGYVGIVAEVLWDTVQNDIPELEEYCKTILASNSTD